MSSYACSYYSSIVNCRINEWLVSYCFLMPTVSPTASASDDKTNYMPLVYGTAAGVCFLVVLMLTVIMILVYCRYRTTVRTQMVSYNKLINSWTYSFSHLTWILLYFRLLYIFMIFYNYIASYWLCVFLCINLLVLSYCTILCISHLQSFWSFCTPCMHCNYNMYIATCIVEVFFPW